MPRELDPELSRISERIRLWREEAGLTLQELARKSEVATSTIQKVETEQMIPSLAVILKIARGLDRRPADLVRDAADEVDVIHLTRRERHPIGVADRMLCERMSGDLFEPAFEMWRVTIHPGESSGQPIHWDGEELVCCERGSVVFLVGEHDHVLRAGDTLHFKASIPHAWRNEGESPARFTVTGTFPRKFRELMSGRVASIAGGRRNAPTGSRRSASR